MTCARVRLLKPIGITLWPEGALSAIVSATPDIDALTVIRRAIRNANRAVEMHIRFDRPDEVAGAVHRLTECASRHGNEDVVELVDEFSRSVHAFCSGHWEFA